jgi:hypothetical protein
MRLAGLPRQGSPAQMSMAEEETQPLLALHTLRALAFQAFLARHGLSLLDVALAAGVRLLTVWKVARDLPVSPQQAESVRAALTRLTGADYRGGITVNQELSLPDEQQRGDR